MSRPKIARGLVSALAAATALTAAFASAQTGAGAPDPQDGASLEQQFRDPPGSARPRVWWHWMNGNITRDGIAKDLAWMKRIGIGGLQNFDANLQTPQIVEHRLVYMTPEWKDAFRFAANEADRLGLELAIASSPGWSETGGPWVKPEDGLKKLVWSETEIVGGRHFSGRLAAPPAVTGPFQSISPAPSIEEMMGGRKPETPPAYYADIALLAVPQALDTPLPAPIVRDGAGHVLDAARLSDSDLQDGIDLVAAAGAPPTLLLSYPAPQTVRSATLFMPGASGGFFGPAYLPRLEASEDGLIWHQVAELPLNEVPTTVSFAAVTARQFRLVIGPSRAPPVLFSPPPGVDLGPLAAAGARPKPPRIGDFRLLSEPRIDRFEAKAGFALVPDYFALSQGVPEAGGAPAERVIDLTGRLRADGTLDWTAPKGRWRILRLGYSLLGTTNHPATAEATGLEVDKFDGAAVRRYLDHYLAMYKEAAGPALVGSRGVRALLTDSIEVGAANWTPQMPAQFRRLRGYDPVPWLPALTGTIVGSRGASDRFLYDFRRTLADLMASEHYGTVATVAHENGLKVYGEALEDHRPSLGDDMAMRSHADIPMSAMWMYQRETGPRPSYLADIKGAASVAHIYGQNLVAAESLTAAVSPWAFGPADLKPVIDLEFATGVNRPVIHTSVHQPTDDKLPGLSLFIFGQYFNRHETWAEMARPWVDYIARNALMLQQGRNVADVAYFYGEEAPLTGLYGDQPVADAPRRYAYDFLNADALIGALANDGSEIVTPGGARYRAIYLGGSSREMTLPVLRRLAALVEGGATVIGARPVGNPSLAGDPAEFDALASKLWPGPGTGTATAQVGKGRVVASTDVEAALAGIGLAPDFRFERGHSDSRILFIHRRLADGDAYFLSNRMARAETIEAHFRMAGKAPELWHAETGTSEPASYRIEGGETIVPLTLSADESVHVVFRKPAGAQALAVENPVPVALAPIDGPWTIAFQPGRGAPATATFATLAPLDRNSEPGIRYFSGIATYTKDFSTPAGWTPGHKLWLDLGEAREVAEVSVNGHTAGTVWHAPYRLEIGALAKPGRNRLQVKVANLWVNRLIGDAQPGAQRITWTALPTYRADAPLRRSGLIGPVKLLAESRR